MPPLASNWIFPRAALTFATVSAVVLASGLLAYSKQMASGSGIQWTDLEGHRYTQGMITEAKATAFIFGSAQCPISNEYAPRVKEIAAKYTARGVRLYFVDSNPEDSVESLRRYAIERSLHIPIIRDSRLAVANWLAADRTPEAVVLDSSGSVRYRGRIDDNRDRTRVVHHDLEEALDAILSGQPVLHPRTLSFGCAIFRKSVLPKQTSSDRPVTYTRDVAPILNRNCVICHRSGETAPFALQTFRQARTWAIAIRDYSARGLMPPWKAVPGWGEFHDARVMSTTDIATLTQWVKSGSPEGISKDLPPPPRFPESGAWELGPPDVVAEPDRPYHLAAEGADVYRNFVLPVDFKADRFLAGMEFKPGNRAVVHHIVLYIDPRSRSKEYDGQDAEPGYSVPGTGIGIFDAEWGEVWVPGRTPRALPNGVAVKVPKGARLVMQVHYHKNGAPQTDRSQVGLYFAHGPVNKLMRTLPLVNPSLRLSAGDGNQVVRTKWTLPADVHLLTIFPHMHLLGRAMKVTATLPDGAAAPLPLIQIRDWDFNWQETYVYKSPVSLPKGTKVLVEATYDNSEANPRQSNHPPVEVKWGEQTTDEMCVCVMGFTVDREKLDVTAGTPRNGI